MLNHIGVNLKTNPKWTGNNLKQFAPQIKTNPKWILREVYRQNQRAATHRPTLLESVTERWTNLSKLPCSSMFHEQSWQQNIQTPWQMKSLNVKMLQISLTRHLSAAKCCN